ncbi:hypothetical protein [Massilibacteroides sp.]|uniref:hypothetical protein n=1 Tax=Massilibacteroides sp. TaxID=2034766 RepID=UPI002633507A|nr:hypothetical protein [Massilibacteroides sp.]MDD4515622.1 hypothetical protein [Massilibacteroides sp.]
MKNILIYIVGLAVIILLILALIGMFHRVNRITDNFETAIQNQNSQYYHLTKKEFKELESTLSNALYEKIKDSLNLKVKHIERTITHEYRYVYDSTQSLLITHENSPYLYFSKDFDDCLHIEGRVKDTIIYWDVPVIDYKAETVFYWKRVNKHDKVRPWPWPKKNFMVTLNKCKGANESEVIEIEINKK